MKNINEEKLQIISFRLPKKTIDFLDDLVDGVYIRDRTHAIRLLIESHYRDWLVNKHYIDKKEYITALFSSLLKTEEDKKLLEDTDTGHIIAKKIKEGEIKKKK